MIPEHFTRNPERLTHKQYIQIGIFIVCFGLLIAAVSAIMTRYFSPTHNPFIVSFLSRGRVALWAYFIYVTVACVIIPIPTLPADVIFLKLFNPLVVIPIRLLADIIGSTIDFYLARKYGRPLLQKWLSQRNYQFIENIAENITWKQFFIVAMIPIINTELMAYAGGISKLRFRTTILSLTLAILYRLLFVYFVLKV